MAAIPCHIAKFAAVIGLEPARAAELVRMLSVEGGARNAAVGIPRFADQVLRLPIVKTTLPARVPNRRINDKRTYKIDGSTVEVLAKGAYGLVLQYVADHTIIKREFYSLAYTPADEEYYRRLLNEQLISIYLSCIAPTNSVNITGIYREYHEDERAVNSDRERFTLSSLMNGKPAYIPQTFTEKELKTHYANSRTNSLMAFTGAEGAHYPAGITRSPIASTTIYTRMEPCGITFYRLLVEYISLDTLTADMMEINLYQWFVKLGNLLTNLNTQCEFRHNDLHPKNVMTNEAMDELVIIDCGMANCKIDGVSYITNTPYTGGYDLLIFILYILQYILPTRVVSSNPITAAKANKLNDILNWFVTSDDRTNIYEWLESYVPSDASIFHMAYPWYLTRREREPWRTLGPTFDRIKSRFEPAEFTKIWEYLQTSSGIPPHIALTKRTTLRASPDTSSEDPPDVEGDLAVSAEARGGGGGGGGGGGISALVAAAAMTTKGGSRRKIKIRKTKHKTRKVPSRKHPHNKCSI